ncbi:MAG: hypothetical protein Q8S44_03820 [Flavobacteriaceae bacterium]|nr:hypothetical protein [Flavobacteriaceae bacterium]
MADTKPVNKKSIPGKGTAGRAEEPAVKKTQVMQSGTGKTATPTPGNIRPQAHIQQAAPTTTVYKPPPGQQPCTAPAPPEPPVPPPTEQPILTELIQRIIADHEAIVAQHDTMQQILLKMTDLITILGTAPKPENDYYDTPQTIINVGTPLQPNSPDTFSSATAVPPVQGYQIENIYAALERIAPKITVINDGNATLFVISSPEGKTWSSENTILIGEARTFWNVWELRLRSPVAGIIGPPTAGGVYRVTERDFWLAYSSAVAGSNINRAAFTAQSVPIPFPATTNLPPIAVPNGFSLTVRATVGNATVIYLANSAANLAIAAQRITLAAGDTASLGITNANLVFVAGAGAGVNNVDILVEQ